MLYDDYSKVCATIIRETMKFIDTSSFKSYIGLPSPNTDDQIYNNAVCDSAPISVIYAPSGTGKSFVTVDRVNALLTYGVPDDKILILNMNVAKTSQMQLQFPCVHCLTFSNFAHDIFATNFPGIQTTNTESVINALSLLPTDAITSELIKLLKTNNPQDRMVLTTMFVNKHADETLDRILRIRKSTNTLEDILCQNLFYRLPEDPFKIDAIIINGIHNMPVPILCTILQYCNKNHCNLFITGEPGESIYDFNMAYDNAMNLLTSYNCIDVVRLQNKIKMTPSINAVISQTPVKSLDGVFTKTIDGLSKNIIREAVEDNPYIEERLTAHKQIMIIARSKQDVIDIKKCLVKNHPGAKFADITTANPEKLHYASIAIKHLPALKQKYNAITGEQLFYEIYNALAAEPEESAVLSEEYKENKNNALSFFNENKTALGETPVSIETAIQRLIDIEANIASGYLAELEVNGSIDIKDADIILSTIHASIDMRCDHVLVFMRNKSRFIDSHIYTAALSRANKSECIVFVNETAVNNPYEAYLTKYATRI